ncbi:MAG: DUF2007 domain-containing protein [Vicinamibacterales bacterium]
MENEWVTIRTCGALHEAELLRSVLAAEAIPAQIPDAHTLGVQPAFAPLLGGVRLLVRREDVERAEACLAD